MIPQYLLERTDYDLSDSDVSVVFGYYRCGVKIEEIAAIINVSVVWVDLVIKNKIKQIKNG